jgi:hypothetical protein
MPSCNDCEHFNQYFGEYIYLDISCVNAHVGMYVCRDILE